MRLMGTIVPTFLFAVLLATVGCDLDLGSGDTDSSQVGVNRAEAEAAAEAAPAAKASSDSSESDDAGADDTVLAVSEPSAVPSPTPTPTPAPAPVLDSSAFVWDPTSGNVKVTIPASAPHWQFHVFSRRTHKILYGPDRRGKSEAVSVGYSLPKTGAQYKAASRSAGDDGAVLVFCNQSGKTVHGWRILNPEQVYVGDGIKLAPGEDR